MTTYATRAPLQLISNPHIMSEASRGQGRRTSARLAEKEDSPFINGIGLDSGPVKGRQNLDGRQGKAKLNGTTRGSVKRKPGKHSAYGCGAAPVVWTSQPSTEFLGYIENLN